jgi:hypothetical protein
LLRPGGVVILENFFLCVVVNPGTLFNGSELWMQPLIDGFRAIVKVGFELQRFAKGSGAHEGRQGISMP